MDDKKNWTFEEVEELYKKFNPSALDGGGKVVMVAEDSAPMRSIIARALERSGFSVLEAPNGLQALKMIRDSSPDCCILDINMPQISGLEILEAMRNDERYASIPVIICTAMKDKRSILVAQKLGAAAYILKPFQMPDLLAKISEVLKL
jgi:CheY-like chemotaxis protein